MAIDEMAESKAIWEQQEGEPNEAYARFLVYRNLGVGRSISSAAASVAKGEKRRSGQWERDSANFEWSVRAIDWDIFNAKRIGESIVLEYIQTLKVMWFKTLQVASDKKTKPKGWAELVETVTTLGAFIPQETVAGIRRAAEDSNSVAAIGHGGTGAVGEAGGA